MKNLNYLFFALMVVVLSACASTKGKCSKECCEKLLGITPVVESQDVAVEEQVVSVVEAEKPVEAEEVKVEAAPEVKLETVHTVQPKETLAKIAKLPEVYGDYKMWPILFEANRDKLSNPSKIYPGQKLNIPRDEAELARLKEEAKQDAVVKEVMKVFSQKKNAAATPEIKKEAVKKEEKVSTTTNEPEKVSSGAFIRTSWSADSSNKK